MVEREAKELEILSIFWGKVGVGDCRIDIREFPGGRLYGWLQYFSGRRVGFCH